MTLVPSYGRDYKSKAEVEAAINANNDFTVADMSSPWDGKQVNKPQLVELGIRSVTVRFGKLRKVAIFKVV
jgi:hypothetical protein